MRVLGREGVLLDIGRGEGFFLGVGVSSVVVLRSRNLDLLLFVSSYK